MAIACLDAPPSFRLVGLDRARELLRSGSVTLLEALGSGEAAGPKLPGAIVWRLQPNTLCVSLSAKLLIMTNNNATRY